MASPINYDQLEQQLSERGPTVTTDVDPKILGAIYGQILILVRDLPDITPEQWGELEGVLKHVAYKLGAVRYHCERYHSLQDLHRKQILDDRRMTELMKKGLIDSDTEIGYEFEAWCHQVKSSLEMLVQVFFPLLGSSRKQFPEPKYGNKGERVITHLQEKKKNKKVMTAYKLNPWKIDGLIQLIRNTKDAWISGVTDWRDTTTHKFSYLQIGFRWDPEADQLRDPIAVDGTPLSNVVREVSDYLLNYSRDFITMTISCKKPQTVLPRPLTDLERRYFSVLWESQGYEMDVNSAKWRFNDAPPIVEGDIENITEGRA